MWALYLFPLHLVVPGGAETGAELVSLRMRSEPLLSPGSAYTLPLLRYLSCSV